MPTGYRIGKSTLLLPSPPQPRILLFVAQLLCDVTFQPATPLLPALPRTAAPAYMTVEVAIHAQIFWLVLYSHIRTSASSLHPLNF